MDRWQRTNDNYLEASLPLKNEKETKKKIVDYQLDRKEVTDLKIHCQLSIVPCQFIGCPYSSLTLWTL